MPQFGTVSIFTVGTNIMYYSQVDYLWYAHTHKEPENSLSAVPARAHNSAGKKRKTVLNKMC